MSQRTVFVSAGALGLLIGVVGFFGGMLVGENRERDRVRESYSADALNKQMQQVFSPEEEAKRREAIQTMKDGFDRTLKDTQKIMGAPSVEPPAPRPQ